jgi:hypothetical protein
MRYQKLALTAMLAATFAACSQDAPTAVTAPEGGATLAKGGNPTTVARKTSLLTNLPISQGSFAGTLSITRIGYDPETEQLLFSGTITRTADGLRETFTNVPGTLSETSPSPLAQFGASEPGTCDILFLDLGPINLDLLGLVLDLSPIQLDLDAQPGPGNLLGNLLCAVTGLLDAGGLLVQIVGILDRINGILDLLSGL